MKNDMQTAKTVSLALGRSPYSKGAEKLATALEQTVTTKHTPGPWRKNEYGDIIVPGGEKLLMVGVALPWGHHPDKDQAEANRDLLAAAPELLEACVKALKWIDDGMPAETRNVAADLEAAIAKATKGGGEK